MGYVSETYRRRDTDNRIAISILIAAGIIVAGFIYYFEFKERQLRNEVKEKLERINEEGLKKLNEIGTGLENAQAEIERELEERDRKMKSEDEKAEKEFEEELKRREKDFQDASDKRNLELIELKKKFFEDKSKGKYDK